MLHSTKRVAIKIQNEEYKYWVKHSLKWLNYNLMSSFIFALLHFFLGKALMLRNTYLICALVLSCIWLQRLEPHANSIFKVGCSYFLWSFSKSNPRMKCQSVKALFSIVIRFV